MARVFRPKFRDRESGEQRRTLKFYIDFIDAVQHRRRIPAPGCQTERQAERFGEMLEALVTAKKYGDRPDNKLAAWLHGLPRTTIRKLAEIGLIDESFVTASTPLEQHINDFEKWFRGTKAKHGFARDPVYIHNVMTQLRHIVRECGCVYWNDLTKAAVESCLGKLDVASKTYNAYLASLKLFGVWMTENGRAVTSPVAGIKPVRWQKTESRRAMTFEEVCNLLAATAAGPIRYGMAGMDRAALYLLGVETGFRSGELREITVGCFDFDSATVTLGAEFCKNRCEAVQYLKRTWADQWRTYLFGRQPNEKVFNMPTGGKVVAMLRKDLEAAGILPVDGRGAKIVFHSLRHTFGTSLDRSGATDKERHIMGRWSDRDDLSLSTYGHLMVHDLRAAVERLPNYPWPSPNQQRRQEEAA